MKIINNKISNSEYDKLISATFKILQLRKSILVKVVSVENDVEQDVGLK